MQVGTIVALVDFGRVTHIGIVECVDPEEVGDTEEVLVVWNDGDESYHSAWQLEVVCK